MKPFDLEAAKRGEPVITKDGRSARIICFDRLDWQDHHLLVALIKKCDGTEIVDTFSDDGLCFDERGHINDLYMAPKKITKWMNIDSRDSLYFNGALCATEEEANRCATVFREACVKVEWEE